MQTPSSPLHDGAAAAPGATTPTGMPPAPRHPPALPAGYRLEGFEFQQVIARSAASIVYLGTDQALDRPVTIKEYLPARLAERDAQGTVHALEPWQEDDFARGLRAFKSEARALARCDHPSLVRVLHLLEANGTAYRVMPHYAGTRLDVLRRAMSTPPDEAALRSLLDALLGALDEYHRVGGAHGAVTPANIMLLADDRPLLLGPGAASHAVASELVEQWLVHLKTSFAPPDAVASASDTPAGIAADLHALAEVARFCITGVMTQAVPSEAEAPRETLLGWQRRAAQGSPDTAGTQGPHAAHATQAPYGTPAASHGAPGAHDSHGTRATEHPAHYGEVLLRALDAASSARLQDWPVSVAQFRGWLDEPASAGPRAKPATAAAIDTDSGEDTGSGSGTQPAADPAVFDDAPRHPAAAAASFQAPRAPPAQTSAAGPLHSRAELAQASRAVAAGAQRATPPGLMPDQQHRAAPVTHDGPPRQVPPGSPAAAASASQPARSAADTTLDPEWLAQRLATARPAHRAARRARLAWLGVGALALVATMLGIGSGLWQIGPPIQVDVPPQFATDGSALHNDRDAATAPAPPTAAPGTSSTPDPRPNATPAPMPAQARGPAAAPMSVPALVPGEVPTTSSAAPVAATAQPSAEPQASLAEKPSTETVNAATAAPAPTPGTATTPAADPASRANAPAVVAPARQEAAPSTTAAPDSHAARPPAADQAVPGSAAAPAVATPAATSPREACAGRTEFSLYRCMQTQCARARWSEHGQCIRLRTTDQVD